MGSRFRNFIICDWGDFMKPTTVRFSENQQAKLNLLSAKYGFTQAELIRYMLDNLDENTLSLALKNDEKNRKVEMQKIGDLRYQNYLFGNVTKNVNQIAKYINSNEHVDDKNLEFLFKQMDEDIQDLKQKLSDYYGDS